MLNVRRKIFRRLQCLKEGIVNEISVPVLIVGAGPAGLATSLLLSRYGVAHMLVEKYPGTAHTPRAHIVNLGSVAGFEVYPGGVGYTASKHAVRAISKTLRLELMGEPIRVTEIAPGMVETEFSLVRFKGDRERAAAVYRGMQPLTGAYVADCIVWAITRAPHVNIDEMVIRPIAQATTRDVARKP